MPLSALDPEQRAAVEHDEGPCLVLAGPGSGKTRVIVERFRRLCAAGVPAEAVLVLTYSRRATDEMRDRAERAHGPLPDESPLTNYHSLAQAIVRSWGWLIGISPAFRIADRAEQWLHLEAVLAELRPRTLWNPLRPHDLIDSLLEVIKSAKQELVTPDRYAGWAHRELEAQPDEIRRALLERHVECAEVYARLNDRYRAHGVLDFEDSILYAEQLVRGHEAARQAVSGVISHLMVDEFQDTDYAQWRLVEALLAGHRNILAVADDDQSIYAFRGASRINLDRFEEAFPERRRIILSRNYRSVSPVVSAARAVIESAPARSRIDKRLTAERGAGACVEVWEADTQRAELEAVAAECARLIDSGTRPGGIALLFRVHADMPPAIRALVAAGVPHVVHGGRGFFRQREVKDMLALLHAVHDPSDSQAILRCLLLPSWAVSRSGRRALVAACRDQEGGLAAVVSAGTVDGLDETDRAAALSCVDTLTELHVRSDREDARAILQEALELSGHALLLDSSAPADRMQAGANLNKVGELMESFAEWSEDLRPGAVLRYLEALRSSRDADQVAAVEGAEEGVVLLTAHAAKGLEWPVVMLPACVDGRWPGRGSNQGRLALPEELVLEQAPEGEGPIDEERRLFYVAVTRAQDRLVLTRARRLPRSFRDERPSPFLTALLGAEGPPAAVTVPADPDPAPAPGRRGEPPPAERLRLSVSALRDFRTCPRRYEYAHRYRMPTAFSPQRWYGELIHSVLQEAAMRHRSGERVDGDAIAGMWAASWRATSGPKGRMGDLLPLGEEQLRRYVASAGWRPGAITAVEQPFLLRTTAADISGRFDRIDGTAGERVTVVDYKTGPPREPETESKDLQVRAYAAALSQRDGLDDVTVELHRLQTSEVTSVRLGRAQLDRAYKQLSATAAEVVGALRDHCFPPRPSARACGRCDFRTVCDEGAGERAPSGARRPGGSPERQADPPA